MNNNIDKGKGFLRDKLDAFQPDPPHGLWESISARLQEGGGGRKIILILSAAASLALAVTLGITYFGREIPEDIELASSPEAEMAIPGAEEEAPDIKESRLEERVIEALAEVPSESGRAHVPKLAAQDRKIAGSGASAKQIEKADVQLTEAAPSEIPGEPTDPERKEPAPQEQVQGDDGGIDADFALDAGAAGQDEPVMNLKERRDHDPRWALGAVLSPLYSFRDAQPEALAGTSGQESGTISYAAGVQVGYRATRRLAIESGVLFNKMGISIGAPGIQVFSDAKEFAVAGPETNWGRVMAVTNTVGNIVSNSGEIYINNYLLNVTNENNNLDAGITQGVNAEQGIQQHLDYLELPFNLRYTVLDRDFKIQLLGGMSTNFLVNNYVTMEIEGQSQEIGYLSNVRNVNYSGNAGLGFVYQFLDQLSLSVEPRFRYYLNSVNDASLPSTRPYTFGIYTGINYFF